MIEHDREIGYARIVRFGILVVLAACSYAPPDEGAQPATDASPDPDSPGMGTNPDGPSAGTDAPLSDGPIIAACTNGYAPLVGGSPAGATYRGVNNKVTWTSARSTCMSDGADLVVIDNAAEAAATTALVQDPNDSLYHWVGLHDNPSTGTDNDWISVRGGAAVYLPWGGSQPNGDDQNCALLSDQGAPHQLFDFECGAPQVFVCECLP